LANFPGHQAAWALHQQQLIWGGYPLHLAAAQCESGGENPVALAQRFLDLGRFQQGARNLGQRCS